MDISSFNEKYKCDLQAILTNLNYDNSLYYIHTLSELIADINFGNDRIFIGDLIATMIDNKIKLPLNIDSVEFTLVANTNSITSSKPKASGFSSLKNIVAHKDDKSIFNGIYHKDGKLIACNKDIAIILSEQKYDLSNEGLTLDYYTKNIISVIDYIDSNGMDIKHPDVYPDIFSIIPPNRKKTKALDIQNIIDMMAGCCKYLKKMKLRSNPTKLTIGDTTFYINGSYLLHILQTLQGNNAKTIYFDYLEPTKGIKIISDNKHIALILPMPALEELSYVTPKNNILDTNTI